MNLNLMTIPAVDQGARQLECSASDPCIYGLLIHNCKDDRAPEARFVIYPGAERLSVSKEIEALNPAILTGEIVTKAG